MTDKVKVVAERVTRVSFEKGRVTVKYETKNGSVWEKHSLPKCTDKPSDEFAAGFKRLTAHALKIVDVTDKRWQIDTEVTEIIVDHEKSGRMAFELTLAHDTGKGSALMYTPSRQERMSETERGAEYASDTLTKEIKLLLAEAMLYVHGDRVQTEMPLDDEQVEEPAEEAAPRKMAAKKAPARKVGRGLLKGSKKKR